MRTLLEIPLLWFASALAAGWLLQRRAACPRWYPTAAGLSSIAILLVVAALNVLTAGFLVSFGANVLSIAAAHHNGQPVYHPLSAPQLYSLIYGPYSYLVYEPLLHGRHALIAVKLELLAVIALTLVSLFTLLARHTSRNNAVALTGFAAALLLTVPAGVLGVRGDMWALLALMVALLALDLRRWIPAAIVAGLCCGFAVDLKATLVVEALLVLVLLGRKHGIKALLAGAATTLAMAAAPFASRNISLSNYLAWLRLSGHRNVAVPLLAANILFALLLLLPAALAWDRKRAVRWPEGVVFALAVASALLAGSASGGGPWHLWPLLPFVLVWTARQLARPGMHRLTAALALAALVLSARWGLRAIRIEVPHMTSAARTLERKELSELAALPDRYPGARLEMAPGNSMESDADDLRFYLVSLGQPLDVDMVAAGEALKTDPAIALQLFPVATSCDTLWVVPNGEVPFATRNNNELRDDEPWIFPHAVRDAFLVRHRLVHTGTLYDLWSCQ